MLKAAAENLNLPVYQDESFLREALAQGKSPYIDNIHLNAQGQGLLSEALAQIVLDYWAEQ